MQSDCDCYYWVEIRLIIQNKYLNESEFIIIDSANDIAWFGNKSTSLLPLTSACEGTHMSSIVLFELAIMLIIC